MKVASVIGGYPQETEVVFPTEGVGSVKLVSKCFDDGGATFP